MKELNKIFLLFLIISITYQKKHKKKRNLNDVIDVKKNANKVYNEELTAALRSFRRKQIEIHSSFEKTFENMLDKVEKENKKLLMKTLINGGYVFSQQIKQDKKNFNSIIELSHEKDFDHDVEYNWTDLESKIGLADPQKIDPQYNEINTTK